MDPDQIWVIEQERDELAAKVNRLTELLERADEAIAANHTLMVEKSTEVQRLRTALEYYTDALTDMGFDDGQTAREALQDT